MSAKYSDKLSNYAGFRIFSETVSAGVLKPEYEQAILTYRETHRGTMTGMTRFRDVLDDMPMVGYGWGNLYNDKVDSFHTALAGHSANYLSRGTFWATEQRGQLGGIIDFRIRNAGSGGEDGSLCMVSAVSPAFWIRWMIVQEDLGDARVFVARGAKRSWFGDSTFGIAEAPTRFGLVSFSFASSSNGTSGSIHFKPHPGAIAAKVVTPDFFVRIRSRDAGGQLSNVKVYGAKLVALFPSNETAVFRPSSDTFTFNATFTKSIQVLV